MQKPHFQNLRPHMDLLTVVAAPWPCVWPVGVGCKIHRVFGPSLFVESILVCHVLYCHNGGASFSCRVVAAA